jgi:hypothetical protein
MTQTAPIRPVPLLERWKDSEPVRLYAYSVLSAVLVALAAVGAVTGEWTSALTGIAAALLGVVPGAEAARMSVISPRSHLDATVALARAASGDPAARAAAIAKALDL